MFQKALLLTLALTTRAFAQVPQANFSISPNPVCAGSTVHITDMSTNSPTAWSYTLGQGPMGAVTSTLQNFTFTYNNPGTRTITLIATNASGASTIVTHTFVVQAAPNLNVTPFNTSTCPGGSVTLTAATASVNTLLWSNGSTNASIAVTPSATTLYSCIATNSAGCTTTAAVNVTVGQPTLVINSNPNTLCGGSTGTLTATLSGQGPFTYSWSTAATTRTISISTPGVYTATASSASGCTATVSRTVTSATSITVGAQAIQTVVCSGNNVNLIATGASSYSWSSGTTGQFAMENPTVNTTYTVLGATGTCTGSAVISIVVNHIPTLAVTSTPATLCAGSTLTINVSGATTYSWNTGATAAQIIVTPSVNTTYSVRGANQGCQPRTATVAVQVSPWPVITISASADSICPGQEVTFTASGAATYVWGSGATTAAYTDTPSATGTYTVAGANAAGCSATGSFLLFVNICTGINALTPQSSPLTVYPNPSNGNFIITAQSALVINVMNETGQLVKTVSLTEANNYTASTSGLSGGIYFILSNDGAGRQKIIVQ